MDLYSQSTTSELLGASKTNVRQLHDADILPCAAHGNCPPGLLEFTPEYIDYLAAKLKLYPATLQRRTVDSAFFKLCLIEWEFTQDEDSSKKRRLRARAACNRLVANGEAYDAAGLVTITGKSTSSVGKWGSEERIPCVRIGTHGYGSYFVSKRYGDFLSRVFHSWQTYDQIAFEASVAHSTVSSWVKKGWVPAFRCPDGRSRIPPGTVNVFIKAASLRQTRVIDGQAVLSLAEAARRLNVGERTINTAAQKGFVQVLRSPVLSGVPVAEVEAWESRFNTLNANFDWLVPHLTQSGRRPQTVNKQQAMRLLGIGKTLSATLDKKELLPFYQRSFRTEGREGKSYVRQYLVGLRRFIATVPKNAQTKKALEYYLLCKKRGVIV